jgi:hypothetical protein
LKIFPDAAVNASFKSLGSFPLFLNAIATSEALIE